VTIAQSVLVLPLSAISIISSNFDGLRCKSNQKRFKTISLWQFFSYEYVFFRTFAKQKHIKNNYK